MAIADISAADVSKKLNEFRVIDVRRPDEFRGELGHIKGATLATLETDLPTYLASLPKDQSYVFVCKSGGRSRAAAEQAIVNGFQKVFNMTGGMTAWNQAKLEVER
jgi:hydroxyacylglutathione hydrolase